MPKFRHLREYCKSAVVTRTLGLLAALVLVSTTAIGAGCSKTSDTTSSTPVVTTFPMTVIDDLGRSVTLDKAPQRIVSLAPSNTEILFDLGLGDKIVGDSIYDDYPAAANDITHVGGYSDIDIEKVVSLNPDLILGEDIDKADVTPALEKLGYKVYTLVPHNLDEIMASVTTIGALTGANSQAKSIVSDMQKRIKVITDKTAKLTAAQKPNVLYIIWQDPIMSSGTDTPIFDMIDKAGGINAAPNDTGFPTMSMESVIGADPQVVICNVDTSFEGGDAPLVFMKTEARLQGIAAAASGKIYGIDASLTNRPVPRIIQGLEWMAAMTHPELFPQFVTQYMSTPFPPVSTTAAN